MDDVWVLDHMMGLTHPALWPEFPAAAMLPDPDALLDPFCVAAALGPTTDLPFGLSVTDAVRRAGPDLARAAMTVNDACRGGFVLGLGSGEAESLVPYGYDYRRPVDRLEAALKDIRALFDTGNMPSGSGRTGLDRGGPKGVPAGVGGRQDAAHAGTDGPLRRRLAPVAQSAGGVRRAVRRGVCGRRSSRPSRPDGVARPGCHLRRLPRRRPRRAGGRADRQADRVLPPRVAVGQVRTWSTPAARPAAARST